MKRIALAAFRALVRGISLVERQAPVAQLDRALDYESRGREFESLRARQQLIDFDSEFLRDFLPLDIRSVAGQHRGNTRTNL